MDPKMSISKNLNKEEYEQGHQNLTCPSGHNCWDSMEPGGQTLSDPHHPDSPFHHWGKWESGTPAYINLTWTDALIPMRNLHSSLMQTVRGGNRYHYWVGQVRRDPVSHAYIWYQTDLN
ncbi:hypothetical protein PROFUN_01189 [Planoprotostelium fungivorum]|uniref:Uncharacterized protein n=1 Tax=Planoprotostelium fungivorum TaxID=1890364 RepID=A0A2P6NCM7_9EUKA|nr:hypothetical protein PROFUN_01189 [Planoprotostelium fungivorum]